MQHPIARTAGLEIEFADVPLDALIDKVPDGWNVVRDGSCTSDGYRIGGMVFHQVNGSLRDQAQRIQVGGELISPPFNLDSDFEKLAEQAVIITDLLRGLGENMADNTSVHVHICAGDPAVYFLKNLVLLWLILEAPIYRMSVAEHPIHRGAIHNDYMYCRPLSGVGPQIVMDNKGYYRRCFDLDKVLKNAKTGQDFIRGMGRADYQPSKWMPFRYYGLNIGSIATSRQTIEFRTFNETLNPLNIMAWVELCQGLVRSALADRKISHLPKFPLGAERREDDSAFRFDSMFDCIAPSFISEQSWGCLERLFNQAAWQPGCQEQVNHLTRTQDRHVPLNELPESLRPSTIPKEYVSTIWDQGYQHNNHVGEAAPRIRQEDRIVDWVRMAPQVLVQDAPEDEDFIEEEEE